MVVGCCRHLFLHWEQLLVSKLREAQVKRFAQYCMKHCAINKILLSCKLWPSRYLIPSLQCQNSKIIQQFKETLSTVGWYNYWTSFQTASSTIGQVWRLVLHLTILNLTQVWNEPFSSIFLSFSVFWWDFILTMESAGGQCASGISSWCTE